MRPSLLVSLVLLSNILLHEVQGIRLEIGSLTAGQYKIHDEALMERSKDVVGEVILCKDGSCSGMIRKLLMTKTTSISSSTTISKNDKTETNRAAPLSEGKSSSGELGGKEENFSINPSPVSVHRAASPEHYPDILDIAGMDYSPAKRKPPIHN